MRALYLVGFIMNCYFLGNSAMQGAFGWALIALIGAFCCMSAYKQEMGTR